MLTYPITPCSALGARQMRQPWAPNHASPCGTRQPWLPQQSLGLSIQQCYQPISSGAVLCFFLLLGCPEGTFLLSLHHRNKGFGNTFWTPLDRNTQRKRNVHLSTFFEYAPGTSTSSLSPCNEHFTTPCPTQQQGLVLTYTKSVICS